MAVSPQGVGFIIGFILGLLVGAALTLFVLVMLS